MTSQLGIHHVHVNVLCFTLEETVTYRNKLPNCFIWIYMYTQVLNFLFHGQGFIIYNENKNDFKNE